MVNALLSAYLDEAPRLLETLATSLAEDDADRAAEQAMRAELARLRPEDGIWGEEFGRSEGPSGRLWVLDPIDGTRAFISGTPTWGVLIALNAGGR